MRRSASAVCLVLCLGLTRSAQAASAGSVIEKARAAIERGDVDPARDLAPLVATLRTARGGGRDDLIDAIEELGGYDGQSPAVVKSYLQREAPPVLIEIAQSKADWTVRGDALMALRSLNAADEFLDRASAVAQADTTKEAKFIRSRGELLQDWKRSRPQPPVSAAVVQPTDAARERRALAFLRQRRLNVSVSQLQSSAMAGRSDEVEALLDAGVSPAAEGRAGSILNMAAWTGCATEADALEGRLKTIRLLIDRGASVQEKDELDNTVLLRAAQHCPRPVIELLVEAGAPVNAANKQGFSPLAAAFLGDHWDVVEYLIGKGARVKKAEIESVFFEPPTDPRKVALIRRATGAALLPGKPAPAAPSKPAASPKPARVSARPASPAEAEALANAAMRGDAASVRALLAKGIDPNARGSLNKSPLRMATSVACMMPVAERDVLAVLDALIEGGADVNEVDDFGLGVLLMAAQKCKAAPVTRLLKAGADPEARSPQGLSPLSMAFIVKNLDAARALVDHGARLSRAAMAKIFPEPPPEPELAALVKRATGAQ